MNKLLHERLRDVAKCGNSLNCVRTLLGNEECPDGDCRDCVSHTAKMLADEIEKYYIPRPRFEDGEPVQGDRLFNSPIDYYYVYNDGSWVVYLVDDNGEDNGELSGHADEFVRLLEPKVLDADGVEIKVGDKVWDLDSGEKLTVVEFANREHGLIQCSHADDGDCDDFNAYRLTHREPDSLEKLRNDMVEFGSDTYFASLDSEKPFDEFIDRLTALIERGA